MPSSPSPDGGDARGGQFGDVVKTAVSYLLSHDRDTAIQMTSVATTMAGREVRRAVSQIIADTRLSEDDH